MLKKFMHAPTIVSFFVVICSKVWTNVLGVGPVGTRKMTFIVGKKPPRGTRGIRRVWKKTVQESQPLEDTPLGNDENKREVPALVMWYLPVTDSLRHIFLNPMEAMLMTWWGDERKVDDDVIAHPADGSQWKDFNKNNKLFSSDPRNVWFALSTNGMNPFNERMTDHNTSPMILTMYNIPTYLC